MMEIPFDAILTLLIFLVGIPAVILQLISAAERRVIVRKEKIDVNSFLLIAIGIFLIGFIFQLGLAWYANGKPEFQLEKLLEQIIWLFTFAALFGLALHVVKKIPEQFGQREKIIENLSKDILQDAGENCKISGDAFDDLVNLGVQCEAGEEREMIVSQLSDFVLLLLSCENYNGDSFEQLIEELIRILVSNPTAQDLNCYALSIRMFSEILSHDATNLHMDDKRRALSAISLLGQTMLEHFKSVQADKLILDYVDTTELAALAEKDLLTDVSQVLFDLGICAANADQDFVAVAALDKLASLAEFHTPMPFEFSVDLLGLLSHFWVADKSRRIYAERKVARIESFLPKKLIPALEDAESHCYLTVQFDTADNLKEMRNAYAMRVGQEA